MRDSEPKRRALFDRLDTRKFEHGCGANGGAANTLSNFSW
jgi:hypothetical protein